MKKLIFLLLTITLVGLTITPMLLDWSDDEKELFAGLEKTLNKKITTESSMEVSWFPLPKISLKDVTLRNKEDPQSARPAATIAKIEGSLSLTSLLSGRFALSSLTLHNASIDIEYYDSYHSNWDNLSYAELEPSGLDTIALVNSTVFVQHHEHRLTFKASNLNMNSSYDSTLNQLLTTGNFTHANVPFQLHATTKHAQAASSLKADWRVDSDLFGVLFQGDIMRDTEGNLSLTGTLGATSNNPHAWADHYVDALQPILPYIRFNEKLQMDGDITINKSTMEWQSIQLSSQNLKGLAQMVMSVEDKLMLNMQVTIDTLDLDPIIEAEAPKPLQAEQKSDFLTPNASNANTDGEEFSWSQPLQTNLQLYIKDASYKNQHVKNSQIALSFGSGTLQVKPSFLLLPHDVRVQFKGDMKRNSYRPIFEGDIYIYGNEFGKLASWVGIDNDILKNEAMNFFNLSAHLTATPSYISLTDVHASLDEAQFSGYTKIRLKDSSKIDMSLDITKLNIDKMLNLQALTSLLNVENDPDHKTLFQHIASQNDHWFIDVQGESITFNEREFDQFQFLCTLAPGRLSIDGLKLNAEKVDMLIKAAFDTRSLNPKTSIDVSGDKLDLSAFSTILPFDLQKEDNDSEQQNQDLEVPGDQATQTLTALWPQKPFDLLPPAKWDGTMTATFKEVYNGSDTPFLQDLVFDAVSKDGVIIVNKAQGLWGEGSFDVKGTLTLNPLSSNFSFGLVSIPYQAITIPYVPQLPVKGLVSLSGSMSFTGNSPYELAKDLKLKASFAARDLTFNHFNLPSLIDRAAEKDTPYDAGNFESLLISATKTGETTISRLDGQMNIDKSVLNLKNTTFSTPRARGAIAGGMNILSYAMNFVSKIAFIPVYNAPRLNLNTTIAGTLKSPVITINADDIINYLNNIPVNTDGQVAQPLNQQPGSFNQIPNIPGSNIIQVPAPN